MVFQTDQQPEAEFNHVIIFAVHNNGSVQTVPLWNSNSPTLESYT